MFSSQAASYGHASYDSCQPSWAFWEQLQNYVVFAEYVFALERTKCLSQMTNVGVQVPVADGITAVSLMM